MDDKPPLKGAWSESRDPLKNLAFQNTGWPHNSILRSTTQGMSGVAVWIHRKHAGALVGYEPISD